ncbi:MAG: hypothetical protein MRY64_08540, partial [Hyphomonadaceae bacterium]|nr:hypothetical protein [Hyphomonadaceae bacterium]
GAAARTSSENGDPPSLSHSREGPVRCGEGAAPAKVEFAEWPFRAGITSVSLMVFENLQARDVPLLLLVGRDRPTSLQFSREGQAVSRDEISIQGLEPYQKAAAVQTRMDQWAGFDAVQSATATQ